MPTTCWAGTPPGRCPRRTQLKTHHPAFRPSSQHRRLGQSAPPVPSCPKMLVRPVVSDVQNRIPEHQRTASRLLHRTAEAILRSLDGSWVPSVLPGQVLGGPVKEPGADDGHVQRQLLRWVDGIVSGEILHFGEAIGHGAD